MLGISKQTVSINKLVLGDKIKNKILRYVPHGLNTDLFFPIQNKEEGFLLDNFFKSDLYKKLMLSTKTTRQFIKLSCLQYLNVNKIIANSCNN